jgi:hypothetical protein
MQGSEGFRPGAPDAKDAATMRRLDLTSTFSPPLAPLSPGARLRRSIVSCLPVHGDVSGLHRSPAASSLIAGGRNMTALALVLAGTLGLAYGWTDAAAGSRWPPLGAFAPAPGDSDAFDFPSTLGIAALATGGLLLLLPIRRS